MCIESGSNPGEIQQHSRVTLLFWFDEYSWSGRRRAREGVWFMAACWSVAAAAHMKGCCRGRKPCQCIRSLIYICISAIDLHCCPGTIKNTLCSLIMKSMGSVVYVESVSHPSTFLRCIQVSVEAVLSSQPSLRCPQRRWDITPPSWTFMKNLHRKVSKRHPTPNNLSWLLFNM